MLFYRLDSLPYGHFRMVMLDVGQGLSVWIKPRTMLYYTMQDLKGWV